MRELYALRSLLFLFLVGATCLNGFCQNPILAFIYNDNLVYINTTTSELRQVPLSSSIIKNEVPRSMTFNSKECQFYVVTSQAIQPKLYKISLTGEVVFVNNLNHSNGDPFYRFEGITYNQSKNQTYISASRRADNYTPYIYSINVQNASCSPLTQVDNNTIESSDADFLDSYKETLIIGDIFSSTIWSFVHSLDLNNLTAVTNTSRIYETNTNFPFTEMAIADDTIFVYYNSKIYASSILSTPLVFQEKFDLSNFGLTGLPRAMTGFPYTEIFGSNLFRDTVLCENDSINITLASLDNFTWNDGSTETNRWIKKEGTYFGTISKDGCTIPSDTFTLKTKPCNKCYEYYEEIQYYLQLGRDIEMCYGEFYSIVLPRLIDSVFWMDGSQGRAKHLTETASLSAIVKVDSCVFYSDTIQITFVDCDACKVHFPNAFTPNNDAINNTFKPLFNDACNFRFESFEIYNRWGEKLYESTTGEWPGNYQNERVQQGVYYYIAKIKELNRGTYTVYSGPIQVLY